MNNDKQNVISTDGQSRHNIKRYEFKVLDSSLKEEDKEFYESTTSLQPTVESVEIPAPPPQPTSTIDIELIEKLLQKSDGLADSLLGVHSYLERQQKEMDSLVKEAREEARQLGIREGQEQMKMALQEEVEEQKRALIASIEMLEKTASGMERQIESIERELSAIAVDIAKEVIAKEVEQNSAEVANALAKNLLESLKDATKILLKLNPQDYATVIKSFEGEERIKIEADKAIARGGVVILSDSGNLDGTILSRFQAMKRSILENLERREQ